MKKEEILRNIVHMYGYFQHKEKLHLVLEHVEGGTLEELYAQRPPNATQMQEFWRNFAGLFYVLWRLHDLEIDGEKYAA
jgi:serine/threonine protein kinase